MGLTGVKRSRWAVIAAVAAACAGLGLAGCKGAAKSALNMKGGAVQCGTGVGSSSLRASSLRAPAGISAERLKAFCESVTAYSCERRVFSPSVENGRAAVSECFDAQERVCFSVDSLSFNTRDAASQPDTDPTASLPGGEYNRTEYKCHNSSVKQGDQLLAVGEGDSLKAAFDSAFKSCAALVSAARSQGN